MRYIRIIIIITIINDSKHYILKRKFLSIAFKVWMLLIS